MPALDKGISMTRAKIRYLPESEELLRAVLSDGQVIDGISDDLDAFAAALFRAGVRHGEADCGDWRLPNCIGGRAVRINCVLAWLTQGRGMPEPLPDWPEDGGSDFPGAR